MTFPVPTARLAIVAAVASLLVVAAPAPWPALLAINGVLLVLGLVDWRRAVPPTEIGVERELPGIVPLGQPVEIAWRVRNPRRRKLRVAVADELFPSLHPSTRRVRLTVPSNGRATARATLQPARRGRFEPREIVLRVEGPMGLATRQGRRDLPGLLRVYPPFRSREEAELRIDRARILEIGLRSAAGRGGGTEFDSLRDYEIDDEFRRIDWSATARAGKTIVRTYRAERNQTVLMLLDSGRMMAGRVAGPSGRERGAGPSGRDRAAGADTVPRLDHAMDAVMMLTAVATRLGDRAGLVAFDRDIRAVVAPGHSRDQLTRVTEAMYAIEPELVESDYRGAFAQTLARFRRRALLVIFTELSEQAMAETLLPALPLVTRRHIVIVASVADPEVVHWARAVPNDAGDSYRKAAAVNSLADRARTVARLRGLGATVIDAEPGRLAPLLADAYLKVKATGRL